MPESTNTAKFVARPFLTRWRSSQTRATRRTPPRFSPLPRPPTASRRVHRARAYRWARQRPGPARGGANFFGSAFELTKGVWQAILEHAIDVKNYKSVSMEECARTWASGLTNAQVIRDALVDLPRTGTALSPDAQDITAVAAAALTASDAHDARPEHRPRASSFADLASAPGRASRRRHVPAAPSKLDLLRVGLLRRDAARYAASHRWEVARSLKHGRTMGQQTRVEADAQARDMGVVVGRRRGDVEKALREAKRYEAHDGSAGEGEAVQHGGAGEVRSS